MLRQQKPTEPDKWPEQEGKYNQGMPIKIFLLEQHLPINLLSVVACGECVCGGGGGDLQGTRKGWKIVAGTFSSLGGREAALKLHL